MWKISLPGVPGDPGAPGVPGGADFRGGLLVTANMICTRSC